MINNKDFKDLFNKDEQMYQILPDLLKDHTTNKNIVWATDSYVSFGEDYLKEKQMFPATTLKLISDGILIPRIQKTKEQQQSRTKNKAEVFTPSWICNKMNNFCDEQWFMRKNVFNTENSDNTWTVNAGKIIFGEPQSKRCEEWQRYVDSRRMEITCGEAPYLVSRYDATTGEALAIKDRIGILDRKLRVVNENTFTEQDWLKWTQRAFEAVYGFEYQGDNLFMARVNLIQTFIDYYYERFNKIPIKQEIKRIANVISWNIWQMDGINDTVPFGMPEDEYEQYNLFEEIQPSQPVYCKVKDWRSKGIILYKEMKGER